MRRNNSGAEILFVGLIAMALACVIFVCAGLMVHISSVPTHYYPTTAIVTEIIPQDDIIVCTDLCGRPILIDGVDDWEIGDYVSILMYDNGTKQVSDDKVYMYRYSGFVE